MPKPPPSVPNIHCFCSLPPNSLSQFVVRKYIKTAKPTMPKSNTSADPASKPPP